MRRFFTVPRIVGGVVLLVLLAVAIAVSTFDPNQFVGPILARIKAATGREIAIGGGVGLKLGLVPKLVLNDVRVGNAPWAKAPALLTAKQVEAQVALLPLLQRRFELVRLHLIEPVIALEMNAQGQGNWEFTPGVNAANTSPGDSSPGTLGIGDLAITRGALTYRAGATGAETQMVIDELVLSARDAQSPVSAEFRGRIDGVAVALTGNLGPLSTIAERERPYPVAVKGEIDGKKTSVAVKVRRSDGLVELQDIDVMSGASNVKGRVDIRHAGPRTQLTVNLTSPSLDVDDLALPFAAALAAKHPSTAAGGSTHFVFADTALSFDALRGNNANGEVTIGRLVLAGGRSLEKVRAQFTLHDGKLEMPVLQATTFGGTVSGRLAVDTTRGQSPTIALALEGQQLNLAALLAAAGIAREVRGGKTEIAIDVTMRGDSPRKWMSGINGRARAVIGPGTLVNAKLDPNLYFDRLAQAVNPFHATEPSTELHCAVIRLPFTNGVAEVDRSIALETKEMEVTVSGRVDFRDETLDLAFRPRVRQGIPIEIPQLTDLVRFRGPFAKPTLAVDAVASATVLARIGAAISTGGLSLIGESLVAGSGSGACAVALGKAGGASPPSAEGAKRGGTPTIADDLGKALGRLLQR